MNDSLALDILTGQAERRIDAVEPVGRQAAPIPATDSPDSINPKE